jgi:hypothetical protein
MSSASYRSAAVAFFLASALSVVAGLLPWIRGRGPNAPFLILALLWFVLGTTMLRRGTGGGSDGAG